MSRYLTWVIGFLVLGCVGELEGEADPPVGQSEEKIVGGRLENGYPAVGAIWRFLPWIRDAVPDVGALTAAYLGLTARRQVSPAIGGAIVLGYLIDLISGVPPGLSVRARVSRGNKMTGENEDRRETAPPVGPPEPALV